MKTTPPSGKIARSVLDDVILPRLGHPRPEVIVGPGHGVDVGVVRLDDRSVLVTTTDPLFVMPELGWERATWFAVHILASDAATSGLAPQYMSVDLNLPLSCSDADLAALWEGIHRTCEALRIHVVAGHTGRYEGCAFPTIGGATLFGIGSIDEYIVPTMAGPGDQIIITKGAAIETAGLFGACYPEKVKAACGQEVARDAAALFRQMSTVEDALTAVKVGVRERGVTAMHDATERGVFGALAELAEAAGSGLVVQQDLIPVPEAAARVCELLDVDPYCTSSEGTLLIACRPPQVAEVIDRLSDRDIAAVRIGELRERDAGIKCVKEGREEDLRIPESDPFWPAFRAAARSREHEP